MPRYRTAMTCPLLNLGGWPLGGAPSSPGGFSVASRRFSGRRVFARRPGDDENGRRPHLHARSRGREGPVLRRFSPAGRHVKFADLADPVGTFPVRAKGGKSCVSPRTWMKGLTGRTRMATNERFHDHEPRFCGPETSKYMDENDRTVSSYLVDPNQDMIRAGAASTSTETIEEAI